jgi:hypothetical protein
MVTKYKKSQKIRDYFEPGAKFYTEGTNGILTPKNLTLKKKIYSASRRSIQRKRPSWKYDEDNVRIIMSRQIGVPLMESEVHLKGIDDVYRFDMVSPDGKIVGEIKTYTWELPSGGRPAAKIAHSSEACFFLLMAEGADRRLLVFTNHEFYENFRTLRQCKLAEANGIEIILVDSNLNSDVPNRVRVDKTGDISHPPKQLITEIGNREKIIKFLTNNPEGSCDDCISTRLGITSRQQVNQICRILVNNNIIERRRKKCKFCTKEKINNILITSKSSHS